VPISQHEGQLKSRHELKRGKKEKKQAKQMQTNKKDIGSGQFM
jgi:hypothetical protein